ncbi:hypothetical protein GCM10022198_10930 [Klugiella xanthotipulae]|uniref:GlcNAc-PI de-N-acetylase n=1 Tax=Klugiella xanthotipulae TaxID=244735 RepID=A0A543HYU8_9MICO|nr:hypothetical protein [Klugiella xanthotipulae]TQM63488.1 hypothetical protein FB466_1752 [Klugiella xanthotipulae]
MSRTPHPARLVFAALATVAACGAALMSPPAVTPAVAASAPDKVSYIVIPHPDDEFEAWSLVENSPDNYKVFITVTRGDETGYCTPASQAYQVGLEKAPTPKPTDKWTASCDNARLNSWLSFFTDMSKTDPSIPGSWAAGTTVGPFPANGTAISRVDGSTTVTDRSAKVWVDTQGRGAAIAFNLGDGDLTAAEVTWAVKTVRDNRTALGINSTLPNWNLVTSFANSVYGSCAVYTHPDHRAIHESVWNTNFGFGYQAGATCATDPDASRTQLVTAASTNAAFSVNTATGLRTGAHTWNYGWLNDTYFAVSRNAQNSVFMQRQSFWIRWVN